MLYAELMRRTGKGEYLRIPADCRVGGDQYTILGVSGPQIDMRVERGRHERTLAETALRELNRRIADLESKLSLAKANAAAFEQQDPLIREADGARKSYVCGELDRVRDDLKNAKDELFETPAAKVEQYLIECP